MRLAGVILLESSPALQALTGTMATMASISRSDACQVIVSSTSLQGPEEGQDLEAYVCDTELQEPQKQSSGILWSAVGQFIPEICVWFCLIRPVKAASTICSIWSCPPGYLVSVGVAELSVWLCYTRMPCQVFILYCHGKSVINAETTSFSVWITGRTLVTSGYITAELLRHLRATSKHSSPA